MNIGALGQSGVGSFGVGDPYESVPGRSPRAVGIVAVRGGDG